ARFLRPNAPVGGADRCAVDGGGLARGVGEPSDAGAVVRAPARPDAHAQLSGLLGLGAAACAGDADRRLAPVRSELAADPRRAGAGGGWAGALGVALGGGGAGDPAAADRSGAAGC